MRFVQKFFKKVYDNFIFVDFESLNEQISINVRIRLHYSKKFNNNFVNYLKKRVKNLRKRVFFVFVVTNFYIRDVNVRRSNKF